MRQRLLTVGGLLALVVGVLHYNDHVAAQFDMSRLMRSIKAVCPVVTGVEIGSYALRSTWRVEPTAQQSCAQATIDTFDPNAQAVIDAELDAEVKQAIDTERLMSAIVWTIIDTYSAPATQAKYNAARTKIITAYKAQPWKP